jgi:serine protease Do
MGLPVEEEPSLQDLYNKTLSSVVNVACRTYDGTASGSGIVLNAQGYIITNYRLVENAETITVELSDQRYFTASVAGADPVSDIAVLRIQAENLTPAEFGDSSQLHIGDGVITMAREARSAGKDSVISGIYHQVTIGGRSMDLFQTDLEPDREGLLLNRYGQIIGIHTGDFSRTLNTGEKQSFAIPSQAVKQIVDELISQGYVSGRPSLGVEGKFLNLFDQHYYHIPAGLYITAVIPGSSAEKQGLTMGDVLISVNDMPISDSMALNRLLCSIQVGETVQAVIYRDERYYTLALTIAEHRG